MQASSPYVTFRCKKSYELPITANISCLYDYPSRFIRKKSKVSIVRSRSHLGLNNSFEENVVQLSLCDI